MQDVGGLGPATPEADTPLTLNVFLSYRRDDTSAYALLLYQSLSDHNGHNVFMDIETLAPGMDFVDAINDTLGRCDILLALVGRGWLTASDAEGNPRLENPEDFVRLEIEAALARNIRVVPVLVGGALMPRRNQLPGDLARLARRHSVRAVRHPLAYRCRCSHQGDRTRPRVTTSEATRTRESGDHICL